MNVLEILGRHMLADGMDLVMDLDRSHGSWIVDQRDGTGYLDLSTACMHPKPLATNILRCWKSAMSWPGRHPEADLLRCVHSGNGPLHGSLRTGGHAGIPAARLLYRRRRSGGRKRFEGRL
ncbi:MAG: hypothetical protein PVI62_00845 [Desulfobacterales bacterium]